MLKNKLVNSLMIGSISLALVACGGVNNNTENVNNNNDEVENEEVENNEDLVEQNENETKEDENENKEITNKDELLDAMKPLIEEGLIFDIGDYKKGEVPKGEYAIVGTNGDNAYFSEYDEHDNVVENKNFNNFGYAYVSGAENLSVSGGLISLEALERMGISGAKEFYEIFHDQEEEFKEAGYYKVGVDIKAGEYTVESIRYEGLVGIKEGAVVKRSEAKERSRFDGN